MKAKAEMEVNSHPNLFSSFNNFSFAIPIKLLQSLLHLGNANFLYSAASFCSSSRKVSDTVLKQYGLLVAHHYTFVNSNP